MCQCGCSYENYWGDCTEFKEGEIPPCQKEMLILEKIIIKDNENKED